MKPISLLLFISFTAPLTLASSSSQCPPNDTDLLTFAYTIQNLLYTYYATIAIPSLTPTFLSTLPDADVLSPLNNLSLATNTATNLHGLSTQSHLALQGISSLLSTTSSSSSSTPPQLPNCTFSLPSLSPSNATSLLLTAYTIEATLCGAFISLAAYVSSSFVCACATSSSTAFLMARLAADHGTHAAYLRSLTSAALFNPESEALVPAFTPQNVTSLGSKVGNLGRFLGGCGKGLKVPEGLCGGGGELVVGPENAVVVFGNVTQGVGDTTSSLSSVVVGACTTMGGGPTTTTTVMGPSGTSNVSVSAIPAQFTGGGVGNLMEIGRSWFRCLLILVVSLVFVM